MKNIEVMKDTLINQIQEMSVKEYYELINALESLCDSEPGIINEKALFLCSKCQKIFGECEEEGGQPGLCRKRFEQYAEREEE